jgi:hypothetical protein
MTGRGVVADTGSEAEVCRLCAGRKSPHIHRQRFINTLLRTCRSIVDVDKARSFTTGIRLQRAGSARGMHVGMSSRESNERALGALSERGDGRVLFENGWFEREKGE